MRSCTTRRLKQALRASDDDHVERRSGGGDRVSRVFVMKSLFESIASALADEQGGRAPGTHAPVDHGRDAWFFVTAATILETMLWGFSFSWGIFQQWLHSHPPFEGNSLVAIGAAGTCALGLPFIGIFFVGQLMQRYPEAIIPATRISLVVCVVSLLVSSWSTQIWQLILLQGVLYGIGTGIITYVYLALIFQWFVRRRGLATGIIFAGATLGGALFPTVFGQLLAAVGFADTMRIWSGILAIVCGPALLVLKPRLPTPTKTFPRKPFFPRRTSFGSSAIFWGNTLVVTIQGLAYLAVSLYITTFIVSLGYSDTLGQAALSVFNACALFGQVGTGWLVDRQPYTIAMLVSSTICALLAFLLWGFADSLAPAIVFAAVFAIAGGGFSATWPIASTEIAGEDTEQASTILSLFSMARGVAAIAGPAIAGALYESTSLRKGYGSDGFSKVIIFVGSLMIATSCGSIAIQYARVWKRRN